MSDSATAGRSRSARPTVLAPSAAWGSLWRLLPLALSAVLFLLPLIDGNPYWTREISLIAVFAMVGSGLNLSLGYAGEVQFGQVFALALGCYVAMLLAIHVVDDILVLVLAGGVAATAAGALTALPALRVGGWALGLTSFFLVITIPDLVSLFPGWTGGLNGLIDIPDPRLLGHTLGSSGLYEVTVAATVTWFTFYRNLITSRYRLMFGALRQSPRLAAALGLSPTRLKASAFLLSAFPAGMAGCLFGFISLVVAPSAFDLTLSLAVVSASILGGTQSVYGPLVGATVVQLGPQSSLSLHQYAPVAYGMFLVVAALASRNGISGLAAMAMSRLGPVSAEAAQPNAYERLPEAPPPTAEELGIFDGAELVLWSVSKSYGGVRALRDVSLTAHSGEITALVGSNGSGKTSLFNVISGYAEPARGSEVSLGDRTLRGLPPWAVARAGVARTFQTPRLPSDASALDVAATARFAADPHGIVSAVLRLPGYRRARREDRRQAMVALQLVGLLACADEEAVTLSPGTQRLLEVARAVCARPRLFLLDEPAAGLSALEADRLAAVLRALADAGATILLVEHNIGFVTRVADTVHVLHLGSLVASGSPESIASNMTVAETYLRPTSAKVGPATSGRRETEMTRQPVLELVGIESGYAGVRILHRLSLDLHAGAVEVVLGHNGSGKTTLLGTVAGLVPLQGGMLTLDGRDLSRLPAHRRAEAGITLVQEGQRVFRERTIMQNMMLGTFRRDLTRAERSRVCAEVLDQFPSLAERTSELAGNLSGGQQQLLAIGQALAARPRVLMLDEPSSGLAPPIVDEIFAGLRRLSDQGLVLLMVEHLAEQALAIADHATVLMQGRIIASGSPTTHVTGVDRSC